MREKVTILSITKPSPLYREQYAVVEWNGVLSEEFPVRNGVRQGGSSAQPFSMSISEISSLTLRAAKWAVILMAPS